jgi:hypothetical protein
VQLYGTQLDSHFEPKPIADFENVDERLSEVGLDALATYVKKAKAFYQGDETPTDSSGNEKK